MENKKKYQLNQANTDTKQSLVLQQIIVRPIERQKQDIGKWRRALEHAESTTGNRVDLYDLYSDVLLDGHLSAVMERRIMNVLNAGIVFMDSAGKESDAMTDYIDTLAFENLLREIILTKFWGFTLLEINPKTGNWFSVPRKHIRPRSQEFVIDQRINDGISYVKPPYNRYMVEIGDREDLGLLLKAAPYVLYKRGNMGDWAQFAEIFGMPFREARYDGYDPVIRAQLEQAMDSAGGAAYAILPKEAEFKIHPNNSTGSKDVYSGLHDTMNKEISKTILGNTETTESSSSSGYAQSKTHAATEQDIVLADRRFVERVLKEKIIPILSIHGWPVEGGWFSFPPEEETLSLKDRVEIDIKLSEKIDIEKSYFYDKYGVPVPSGGELVTSASTSSASVKPEKDNAKSEPVEDEPIEGEDLSEEELKLFHKFKRFFKSARPSTELRERAFNLGDVHQLYIGSCSTCDDMVTLAEDDTLAAITENVLKAVYARQLTDGFNRKSALQIAELIFKGVQEGYGVQIGSFTEPDRLMMAALETNVYQFSAAKDYQMCQQLTKLLVDEAGNVREFAAFRREAAQVLDKFVGNWLKTEYNHAVASAQMAGNWVQIEANKATLPNLTYKAVMDARTSDEHRLLNDITRPVGDAFWLKYYPPNRFNCRCNAVSTSTRAVTSDSAMTLKKLPELPAGFSTNLAAAGKVFPAEHPYYVGLPESVKNAFNDIQSRRA